MNPVKGIDDRRNDYDDTQQFVSEQKQIARMADEKSPARISHRRFATSCSEMRIIMQIKHFDTLPEDAVFIRKEVFVKEQGFKNEFDEKDNEAHFLVGYENDSRVATCRIFYDTAKSI